MLIVLVALAALAAEADPEGVVVTAPSGQQSVIVGAEAPVIAAVPSASAIQAVTPHGLNTAQQIDRWIGQGAGAAEPFDDDASRCARADDRKIHGSVSASIGTHDYSRYSAEVSIPVGETARVDLAYSQSRNDPYVYGLGGYGLGRYGAGRRGPYGYDGYGWAGDQRRFSVGAEFGRDTGVRRPTPVWDRLDLQGREKSGCETALAD